MRDNYAIQMETLGYDISGNPLNDIVDVVRCKDCKHRPTDNSDEKSCGGLDIEFPDTVCPCYCEDGYYSSYPNDDWFCANGEMKEG